MKLKVLILLFVPFMLAACRDDDNPRSRPNFVETSFTDISGELTNDYGEEVLTDRNTLYGISVRLDNLHTYSYGLFGHSCISPWQYNHVIQRLWTL